VDALSREQWKSAQMLFEKSLQAATLADDNRLMSLGWYNLGRARAADGKVREASAAYQQAILQAEKAKDAISRQRAALALALLEQTSVEKQANHVSGASNSLLNVPESFPVDVHLAAARLAYLRQKPDMASKAYGMVLKKAGQDRAGLIYAARAHLGLAQISRDEAVREEGAKAGADSAWKHLYLALDFLHRAGEPRLMLQALNLAAEMEADPARQQQWQERAAAVQQALHKARSE
jgi:tetratricopeptide (TPR) repeat protein